MSDCCHSHEHKEPAPLPEGVDPNEITYICPMHPEVIQKGPGT